MHAIRTTLFAVATALLAVGCDAGDDGSSEEGTTTVRSADPWGWFEVENSPIAPYCSVVLVAPDVAVTATECVKELGAWELRLGFGEDLEATLPVDTITQLDDEPRLSALVLRDAVLDVEPANLAVPASEQQLQSASKARVIKGEIAESWTWSGLARATTDGRHWIEPEVGSPNCHGDLGAAVFNDQGALVGVAVGVLMGANSCAEAIEFVAVRAEQDAFDEALTLVTE